MSKGTISIVILTYNRLLHLKKTLRMLYQKINEDVEVIVVDNHSDVDVSAALKGQFDQVRVIRLKRNFGAVGRNYGIKVARGDLIITLDDDVYGLDGEALNSVRAAFEDDYVGAVCFKVLDEATGQIVDWVHKRKVEAWANERFTTIEISEGAVAFRKKMLGEVGLYPEHFFISHEGADMVYRMMDKGYRVIYEPCVSVFHAYAEEGRASWRRYYYDTRNTFWLAARNLPFAQAVKCIVIGSGSMFVYALRDGYLRYWWRGVGDGLRGMRQEIRGRQCITKETVKAVRETMSYKPGVFYLLKKRVWRKGIRT